jgi:hypothetical protein
MSNREHDHELIRDVPIFATGVTLRSWCAMALPSILMENYRWPPDSGVAHGYP